MARAAPSALGCAGAVLAAITVALCEPSGLTGWLKAVAAGAIVPGGALAIVKTIPGNGGFNDKSVTLSVGEPEPQAAPPRPFNPALMTATKELRPVGKRFSSAGSSACLRSWLSRSLASVGLWYAWQFTNASRWLALSAGLIAIAIFSAGMPIAWS